MFYHHQERAIQSQGMRGFQCRRNGYKKATVKLSHEMIGKMKKVENEVNEVLDEWGFDKVTIVYGNRIYAKMKSFTTRPNTLKLQSVYINNHNKSLVQMWLWSY